MPDKPEKVPSGSEPKEWATKALAGSLTALSGSQGRYPHDNCPPKPRPQATTYHHHLQPTPCMLLCTPN